MSDRTLPTTTSQNQYWPCDTPEGLDLFTFLSGSKVSNSIREGVGTRLKKHGLLKMNEFATAEKRLREYPKAEWTKTRISEESWGERIDVRRVRGGVAGEAHVAVSHVVDEEHHEVRFVQRRAQCRGAGRRGPLPGSSGK